MRRRQGAGSARGTTTLHSSAWSALAILLAAWLLAPDAPVADAARTGDAETVRSLLAQGEDVNAALGDGMTALHWAAANGDAEMTELLVEAGATLEARTRVGEYTPLLVAAKSGRARLIPGLIDAGADPRAATTTGVTALHFASATGWGPAVQALVDAGADVNAADAAQGQTPLMFAAASGRAEAIRILVGAGATVDQPTLVVDIPEREKNDRVLQKERDARVQEIKDARRQELIDQGLLPPDEPEEEEDEESGEAEASDEPLGPAEAQGAPTVRPDDAPAEPGFNAGVEDEDEDDSEGDGGEDEDEERSDPWSHGELIGGHGGLTALLHAARAGQTEAALALLEAGADVNHVSEGDHTSPLLIASLNGHFDLALELLARGADPNLASDAGTAPLYAAINLQWAPKSLYPQPKSHLRQDATYLEYMKALLDAGADPNARLAKHLWYMSYNFDLLGVDTGGATPFWRAAYGLDIPAMQLLLDYGADPSIPTKKAPQRRRRSDRDVEDPSGLEPIPVGGPAVYPIHAASGVGFGKGYAANSHRGVPDGWVPAVRFLVEELGADVNARDHEGYNPVHHAASRGDTELIEYLVSMGADVTALSRRGQTTADMANGPFQRVQPWPEAVALLEELGSENNHNCVSC